jgi:propanediol dehydratase small subunit
VTGAGERQASAGQPGRADQPARAGQPASADQPAGARQPASAGQDGGGEQAGVRALSGRPVGELTLEAVRRGEISLPDLRIHPGSLEYQAAVAEAHGNPQLAENLRRAAELTTLGDDEVLAIYEALRPGRSTATQLTALAASLDARGLPRCAALLAEAAEIYTRRGLTA